MKNSKFIGIEELKAVYSELDYYIKQDYDIAKKAKKQIDDLDHKKPASLEKKEVYDILENVKKNIKKYTLKYDSNYSFNKYYQKNKEIYEYATSENADDKFVGSISFDKLTINYDPLELFETTYTLKYYNHIRKQVILIENVTKKKLIKELENTNCFLDKKNIEPVLNHLIIFSNKKGDLKVTEIINKKGFFIIDGKLKENVDLSKDKYTIEEVKIAIETLNNILECSKEAVQNNAVVCRFMLHSPFHFCIKQLGRANNNLKGLILHGESNTSKSTTFKIGQWFYHSKIPEKPITTDTVPAFSRLIAIDTFPSLFDDSYNLLTADGMNQTIKSSIIDIIGRNVTNNETGGLNPFVSLSTPVFTFNENYEVKDGSIRRLDVHYYNSSMIMKKKDRDNFTDKYNPESADSSLICLNALGWIFKEKIKHYLENNDTSLNNIDKLTIELLKEIAKDVGVELNPYLLKEAERDDSLDEDIPAKLKKELNKWLNKTFRTNGVKKHNNNGYCKDDFITAINMGLFTDWLYYQPTNNCFILHKSNFKKFCNELINNSKSFEDLNKYLDLELNHTESKSIAVQGKVIKGYKIAYIDIAKKIFNINLIDDDTEDLYNY